MVAGRTLITRCFAFRLDTMNMRIGFLTLLLLGLAACSAATADGPAGA